jgi:phosphopantetheine adenylyltransferase/dephospho-CoA kinase
MKIIALTGGIASGKSTAARYLKELGAHVIDADLLGHRAYEPGSPAHAQVVAAFGQDVLAEDGSIARKVLGGKVFGKPDQLKKLTDIVWPAIRTLAEEEIARVRRENKVHVVLLEAAVLFEAGWESVGDEVWVNIVDREVAIERTMQRDKLPREAIEARLNSQLTNAERTARADHVIDNNGTQEAMLAQLREHWQRINAA